MLEEDRRVVAPQRGPQQAHRVLGVGRNRDLPPRRVGPQHLAADAVPRIAALGRVAARHPDHDRRGPAIVGAPADGAAVVELLRGGVGVLPELDLRHRHEPGERHPDRAPDDAFLGQAGVEDPLVAERVLEAERGRVHAALGANVLAEHEHLRIGLELALERAAHRGEEVDPRPLRPWRLVRGGEHVAFGARPPRVACSGLPSGPDSSKRYRVTVRRIGLWPRQRAGERLLHVGLGARLDLRQLRGAEDPVGQEGCEPGQRIARRAHARAARRPLYAWVSWPECPESRGTVRRISAGPCSARACATTSPKRRRGLGRIGAVAVADQQVAERGQVGGDVGARGLQLRRDRDAVAVVLDVEQHRQLERGRDGERRPEAVGGDGRFTAQHARRSRPATPGRPARRGGR